MTIRVLFKSQVNPLRLRKVMILKWLSIQILFRHHMTVMIRNISTQAQLENVDMFYIKGRETHVGSCSMGIDDTMISSEINLKII